ncbi:MAG: ATP-binding protein [Bacteroidales bacterium]|nr:ATP-binding protein [Bacteroidales bacterium]
MILDFSISNFRSIREKQTLSFEATNDLHLEDYFVMKKKVGQTEYRILKLLALLGANASGKSNLLKAFFLFPQLLLEPCATKTDFIKYTKFALSKKSQEEDSEMVVNFLVGESKYCYTVRFNNQIIRKESLYRTRGEDLRQHRVYQRETSAEPFVSTIKWGDKYKSAKNTRALTVNLLHNRTLFGAYQYSNVVIDWMEEILRWSKTYIMPIVTTGVQRIDDDVSKNILTHKIDKAMLTELMRKADIGVNALEIKKEIEKIPDEIVQNVLQDEKVPDYLKEKLREDPTQEEYVIRMLHKGEDTDAYLPFEEESNGTKRYYEMAGILIQLIRESHFVAIDELECRLHPDLYQHFVLTFLREAKDSQIIFTTHNREFLGNRDLYRDDAIWFAQKTEVGATEAYSLADFGTGSLRKDTNRYKAYCAGILGGVPQLEPIHFQQTDTL